MHSPFCDALVGSDDGGLNVNGVILHPSQLHRLIQRSYYIQGIMPLYRKTCPEHVYSRTPSYKYALTV